MNEPKVSVIVLSYNSAATVEQALDSVLGQVCTFEYEVVVGDDASTDGTQEILRRYLLKHPDKVRLMLAEKNRGLQDNYFDCMEHCRADIIADCAADDYWNDCHRLQKMADALESRPDAAMVYTDWNCLDENTGQILRAYPRTWHNTGRGELTLTILTSTGAPAVHLSATLYRKSAIAAEYTKYRDDIYRCRDFACEDLPVLVALSRAGASIYLATDSLVYRTGHSSVSSEENPAKAARFSLAGIRLRIKLMKRHNMLHTVQAKTHLEAYCRFALSMAILSDDKALVNEAMYMAKRIPASSTKLRLTCIVLGLPGGRSLLRFLKRFTLNLRRRKSL